MTCAGFWRCWPGRAQRSRRRSCVDQLAAHDRDELDLVAAVRRRILAGEPLSTEEAAAAARFVAAVRRQ